jgi:hypothetical protein
MGELSGNLKEEDLKREIMARMSRIIDEED